jgi:hypothetical protein
MGEDPEALLADTVEEDASCLVRVDSAFEKASLGGRSGIMYPRLRAVILTVPLVCG